MLVLAVVAKILGAALAHVLELEQLLLLTVNAEAGGPFQVASPGLRSAAPPPAPGAPIRPARRGHHRGARACAGTRSASAFPLWSNTRIRQAPRARRPRPCARPL